MQPGTKGLSTLAPTHVFREKAGCGAKDILCRAARLSVFHKRFVIK